jgi:hypothetical protein
MSIKVVAYGVPALIVGIVLLLIGYPINHSDMITNYSRVKTWLINLV